MKNTYFSALLPSVDNLFIWLNAIIMLGGIFVFNWKPEVVVIAYFLETIIIGIIHVWKMFIVLLYGDAQKASTPDPKNRLLGGFGAIPFFILHYFFFIFVQSIFIFTMLGNLIPKGQSTFNVFANYAYLLTQHDIQMAFFALALSNVAQTLKDFIIPAQFRKTTIARLFFKPYIRIFIQQFVTILAMFFIMISSSAWAGAILIIIFRLIVDLFLQRAGSDVDFKNQLIKALKKGQKPEEAKQTQQSLDSFLEK